MNMAGPTCRDDREEHRTDPPTQWFVAETDRGRRLKICFVLQDGHVHIKTAYEASDQVALLFTKKTTAK